MTAPNKNKEIDPQLGYLAFTYLIQPDIFVKDINPPIPIDKPFTIPANSPNKETINSSSSLFLNSAMIQGKFSSSLVF